MVSYSLLGAAGPRAGTRGAMIETGRQHTWHRSLATGIIGTALLGVLVCPAALRGQRAPERQDPIIDFATRVVTAIQSSETMMDRQNISRYFATYPLMTDQAEAQRLLSTAERILRAFALSVQTAASETSRELGAASIQPAHVEEVIRGLLPRQVTPYKTFVYFPAANAEDRLEIEAIDLEAFAHTPLPWGALVKLASSEPAPEPGWSEQAVPLFAQAVSDYGLLLFRLAGESARDEYAQAVASPHLRNAEKALGARAAANRAPQHAPTAPDQPLAPTPFVDVAAEAGVRMRHVSSDWLARFRRFGSFAPTFSGGGVSAGDLDGDRYPDLVFCGGSGCRAFSNRGDGTFLDVTEASGLEAAGEARMAVIADLDNDGDRDVFITYARDGNRLFENLGSGRFRDVSTASGLFERGLMSGPAIAFDYDNDGLLDLYVGSFGDYLAGETPWQMVDNQNAQPNRLYRNRGELSFEDVTSRAGVGDTGWSQALSHVDYNLDGFQDIYISNDFGRNELFENRGDGTFSARGASTGSDDEFHGMNVAFADFNRDARPDILITNIWGWLFTEPGPGEYNKLLLSRAEDGSVAYEMNREIIPELDTRDTGWSWAALFFDADNDGDDDLYLVNGHSDYSTFVQYRPHPTREGAIYPINNGRETNLFFRNDDRVLRVPDEPSGAELSDYNSRSIALLDFDLDGDLDIAVSLFHEFGRLFRNDLAPSANHWLRVELVGDPSQGTSRDAIGAQVIARSADGLYTWRTVTGGEGYLGFSTLPVDFGLGTTPSVDLEIWWPGRKSQKISNVAANQWVRIRQGQDGFDTISTGKPEIEESETEYPETGEPQTGDPADVTRD